MEGPAAGPPAEPDPIAPRIGEVPPVPPAATVDVSQQLQFLYKALDDNQNLIRFIDTKAAFAVALLSAMTGKVLSDLGSYFPRGEQPLWRQFLVLAFLGTATAAAFVIARILFPTNNPAPHISLLPETEPKFFLWQLKPKKWGRILSSHPRFSRLADEHGTYLSQVSAATSFDLLRSVSAEVLKISYIRQIKTDRLKALGRILAVSVLAFVFLIAADVTRDRPAAKPVAVEIQGPVSLRVPDVHIPAEKSQPTKTQREQEIAPNVRRRSKPKGAKPGD